MDDAGNRNQEAKDEEGGAVPVVNLRAYGNRSTLRMAQTRVTKLGPGVSSLVATEPSSSHTPLFFCCRSRIEKMEEA